MVHGTSTIEKIFQNARPLEKKYSVKSSLDKMLIFLEANTCFILQSSNKTQGSLLYNTILNFIQFLLLKTPENEAIILIH